MSEQQKVTLTEKEFNTVELALNHYAKSLAVDGTKHLLGASEVGGLVGKLKPLAVDEDAQKKEAADLQASKPFV